MPETGFGTGAPSAGWETGTGLGVPLVGIGGMSLGALLIGSGLGRIGDLGSFGGPETGGGSAEGSVGAGLGIPGAGGGALSLGALSFGTGAIGANLTSLGPGGGAGGGTTGPVGMGLGITAPGGGRISFASLGVFATCLGTVEWLPEPLTPICFPDPWPPVGTGPGGMLDNGLPSWGGGGGESPGW